MDLKQLEEESLANLARESMSQKTDLNDKKKRVLEIGCGWGSFLLYAATKFPSLEFVGFSNSATQILHIQNEAKQKRLHNVKVMKLDINDFCDPTRRSELPEIDVKFNRIISIECLEHRFVFTC